MWNGLLENLAAAACRWESLMKGAAFLSREKENIGVCLRFESHDGAYQRTVSLVVGPWSRIY